MKSLARAVVSGCFLFVAMAAQADTPSDVPGSRDPAFLKRYEGSKIISYQTRAYDRYRVVIPDPKKTSTQWADTVWTDVEGQITRIVYQTPAGHTVLELLRNYENALDEAGLGRLAKGMQEINIRNFGGEAFGQSWQAAADYAWSNLGLTAVRQMAYVSAKGTRDGQDVTAAVLVLEYNEPRDVTYGNKKVHFDVGQITIVVDVVSAKAVQIRMVEVKAADLADALATKGKVDIYGILFDTDKTDIKPESAKTLDEVASLLKIDRSLKLEIAGHTDNTGEKEHNMRLSEGRATAVVNALVKTYGIDAARLSAKGYGDTKPVSPNDSEPNRAKNRRVELKKI